MKGKTWRLFQGLTPMRFGALGTFAIFAGVYWLGRQPAPGDAGGTRASEFWSLPLNSMGDALAGLAASLAFLWLIVTAFIQKNELKEQRAELELARKESKRMAEALEAQADVFRDEQRQRRELDAGKSLQRLLEVLAWKLDEEARGADLDGTSRAGWSDEPVHVFPEREQEPLEEYLYSCAGKIADFWNLANGEYGKFGKPFDGSSVFYDEIVGVLEEIERLLPELGRADRFRVKGLGLMRLLTDTQEFIRIGPWSGISAQADQELNQ